MKFPKYYPMATYRNTPTPIKVGDIRTLELQRFRSSYAVHNGSYAPG